MWIALRSGSEQRGYAGAGGLRQTPLFLTEEERRHAALKESETAHLLPGLMHMRAAARKGDLDVRRDQKRLVHQGIIVRRVRNVIVLFVGDVAVRGCLFFKRRCAFDANQHFTVPGTIDLKRLLTVNIVATSGCAQDFPASIWLASPDDGCQPEAAP